MTSVTPGDLVRIMLRFSDEPQRLGVVIQREPVDDSLTTMITVLLAHNMRLERYAMHYLVKI